MFRRKLMIYFLNLFRLRLSGVRERGSMLLLVLFAGCCVVWVVRGWEGSVLVGALVVVAVWVRTGVMV
jgi:hypothetical protein